MRKRRGRGKNGNGGKDEENIWRGKDEKRRGRVLLLAGALGQISATVW